MSWLLKVAEWLLKLIGGFLPIGTKPFPEWAGKLIWAAGIALLVNIALGMLVKPNVTEVTKGGTQIINQAEPRDVVGVGCNVFRIYVKGGIKSK